MNSFIKEISKILPDKIYLQIQFFYHFHSFINFNNPKTYNEKLQVLKLTDRNPRYTNLVDKCLVKEYVAEKIGTEYIIPTLRIYDSIEDIKINELPEQFVMKWNHDSGSIIICKDKSSFDFAKAQKSLKAGEKFNGFWYGREWPYKNVVPKLIVEPYLEDKKTKELRDYKVFTFNGKAKILLIASDRQKVGEDTKFDFFDVKTKEHLNIVNLHENAAVVPELPSKFNEMVVLSEKLSFGFKHLRVDFYEVDGHVYFGELTFYHGSGFMTIKPEEWNQKLGDMITL